MALIEPHEIPTTSTTPPASFWLWGSDPSDGQTSKKLAIDDLYRRATGAANLWVDAQSGSANVFSRGTASGGFIAQDTGATSGVQAFQLFTNGGVTELRGMNDALSAGTASFMAVDMTNNRIGFGTAAPPVKLYATGTGSTELIQIKSTAVNGQAGFRMANDAQTYTVYVSSADDLIFADNTSGLNPIRVEAGASGSSIYVADSGGLNPHVGIGTTSPQGALHVVDFAGEGTPTFNAADKFIFQGNASANSFTRMSLIGGTTADVAYMMGDKDAHDECRLQWRTDDRDFAVIIDSNRVVDIEAGAPANSVYIASDGDVGMGTASPSNRLHVLGTSGITAIVIQDTSVNAFAAITTRNDAQNWGSGVRSDDNWAVTDNTNSKVPFKIEPNAPTNACYVDADGHVGLGADPGASIKFYVLDSSTSMVSRFKSTGTNAVVALRVENDVQAYDCRVNASDHFQIRDTTNNKTFLTFESNARADAIYLDATGGGLCMFGTTAELSGLTIRPGNDSGTAPTFSDQGLAVVGTSSAFEGTAAYVISGTAGNAGLFLGDSGSAVQCIFQYDNNSETMSIVANAVTQCDATSSRWRWQQPVEFENMTTTTRNGLSPSAGWTIFNTTTGKLEVYDGTTWQACW